MEKGSGVQRRVSKRGKGFESRRLSLVEFNSGGMEGQDKDKWIPQMSFRKGISRG